MPKPTKSLRSFRCSDAFWSAIEKAASEAGMSSNEWLNLAAVRNLQSPLIGEPTDLCNLAELKKADELNSLQSAINRTNKIFEQTAKSLGVKLKL